MKSLLLLIFCGTLQIVGAQPLGIKVFEGSESVGVFLRSGVWPFSGFEPSSDDITAVASNSLFYAQSNYIYNDASREAVVYEYDYWRPDGASSAFQPVAAREVRAFGDRRKRNSFTNDLPLPDGYYLWSGPSVLGVQHQDEGDTRTIRKGSLTVTYTNNVYAGMAALYTYTCVDNKGGSWVWYVRVEPREQKTVTFNIGGATKEANHPVKWFQLTSLRLNPVFPAAPQVAQAGYRNK